MTILRSDLAIFKPEQLGNSEQAGGQRTNNKVTSGLLNDLFTPISDIDHAQSAVNIVKCFPTLNTLGTEQLIGSHIFVNRPPVDPLVSVLIVESDELNDNSRMPDMVEILESSVTAGALINSSGPEFLQYQDNFSKSYLTMTEPGTAKVVTSTLNVGDIIAISVEYTGTENTTYPRAVHYAQVTELELNSVIFSPGIEFATPAPTVSINGQTGCTKLRKTNSNASLIYHGVTTLTATAATNAVNIPVVGTKQSLVPSVLVQQSYINQTIGGDDTGDSTITLKTTSQTTTSANTYNFTLPDLLPEGNANVNYRPSVLYTSIDYGLRGANQLTIGAGSLSATLGYPHVVGSEVIVSYLSTSQYENYSTPTAFPANRKVVNGTLNATVMYGGSRVKVFEIDSLLYVSVSGGYIPAGSLDYETGVITPANLLFTAFQYSALLEIPVTSINTLFPLPFANPKLDTFYFRVVSNTGSLISGASNLSGVISGSGVSGLIENGMVFIEFSTSVNLSTLRYDVIDLYESLPPADTYGLNPLRMPANGVVSIFRRWGVVAIQHSQYQTVASPAPGQVKTIRSNVRFADITDAENRSLWTAVNTHYTLDIEAGTVTINSNFPGFTAPFTLVDTIGELALVSNVGDTSVSIAAGLSREYPVGSTVASVQNMGDLQARVGPVRDMTSWSNNWDIDGTPATANLNTAAYPIEVTNDSAVNEDWVIIFTSATNFRLVGRNIGQVATGDTLNDFIPINTVVNKPYFIIRSEAFGGGWSPGEAIRFETFAASKPVMLVRVVKSGHSQIDTDRAIISFRGNEA